MQLYSAFSVDNGRTKCYITDTRYECSHKTNKQSRTNERMGYRNEDTLCRNDGMRYDN